MKLFNIKTNLPKERIEEAIMSACTPFKLGEIHTYYEGEKFAIWDISDLLIKILLCKET